MRIYNDFLKACLSIYFWFDMRPELVHLLQSHLVEIVPIRLFHCIQLIFVHEFVLEQFFFLLFVLKVNSLWISVGHVRSIYTRKWHNLWSAISRCIPAGSSRAIRFHGMLGNPKDCNESKYSKSCHQWCCIRLTTVSWSGLPGGILLEGGILRVPLILFSDLVALRIVSVGPSLLSFVVVHAPL